MNLIGYKELLNKLQLEILSILPEQDIKKLFNNLLDELINKDIIHQTIDNYIGDSNVYFKTVLNYNVRDEKEFLINYYDYKFNHHYFIGFNKTDKYLFYTDYSKFSISENIIEVDDFIFIISDIDKEKYDYIKDFKKYIHVKSFQDIPLYLLSKNNNSELKTFMTGMVLFKNLDLVKNHFSELQTIIDI